jgi:hypothetical protein
MSEGSRWGRTWCLAALAAAAALGAVPVARAATALMRRPYPIAAVAMDGDRVAVASYPQNCARVDLTDVRGARPVRLSRRSVLYCEGAFGGSRGAFIALAGSRAYWVFALPGNGLYPELLTAAPGSFERQLVPPGVGDRTVGPFLGPVAASGTTLAYSTYRLEQTCAPAGDCTFSPPLDATLTLRGRRVAVPAPGGIVGSVDSGRAAVMLGDGRVAVVRAHGPSLVVSTGLRSARSVAIAGGRLVVLAGERLYAFDATSGRLHGSYPAAGATHVDLWAGIAVLTTGRTVVALRVANGHRRTIATVSRGRRLGGYAEVEAGGIVWATTPAPGPGTSIVWRVPLPALR